MTPQGGLFLSDGQDQRAIHMERCNRCSPSTCEPYEVDAFPLEMRMPGLMPWIVQSHFGATVRINRRLACGFTERT